MREIVGYVLVAQAILTGIIVYTIMRLGDSIKEAAAYVGTGEGTISWGSDFPLIFWILLLTVAGFGIVLILRKGSNGR